MTEGSSVPLSIKKSSKTRTPSDQSIINTHRRVETFSAFSTDIFHQERLRWNPKSGQNERNKYPKRFYQRHEPYKTRGPNHNLIKSDTINVLTHYYLCSGFYFLERRNGFYRSVIKCQLLQLFVRTLIQRWAQTQKTTQTSMRSTGPGCWMWIGYVEWETIGSSEEELLSVALVPELSSSTWFAWGTYALERVRGL